MKRVIIESPYAGSFKKNLAYARACVKDSLLRGEAPIASHLLYTQEGILNDSIPEERRLGIDAGLAWTEVAEAHIFYIDYGYSRGMEQARKIAEENTIPIEERTIYRLEEGGSEISRLLTQLQLKLISMSCYANEFMDDRAEAITKMNIDELRKWISLKRDYYGCQFPEERINNK
jgi:hypothetical protein